MGNFFTSIGGASNADLRLRPSNSDKVIVIPLPIPVDWATNPAHKGIKLFHTMISSGFTEAEGVSAPLRFEYVAFSTGSAPYSPSEAGMLALVNMFKPEKVAPDAVFNKKVFIDKLDLYITFADQLKEYKNLTRRDLCRLFGTHLVFVFETYHIQVSKISFSDNITEVDRQDIRKPLTAYLVTDSKAPSKSRRRKEEVPEQQEAPQDNALEEQDG